MHMCHEYPNAENLERVHMRKSKLCEICLEDGREVIDNTEHNLLTCKVVIESDFAATQLRAYWELCAAEISATRENLIFL